MLFALFNNITLNLLKHIPTTMIFKNAISWFEIPAVDINRAQKFYEAIFDIQMIPLDMPQLQMRLFPIESPMNIGGAICYSGDFYKPSAESGPLVYLNGNPDVQNVLDKIETAGGKIVIPKTQISPEYGYMAVFLDTEGNRIALHSVPQG
jgi:predicted enzyme related to lactoylglutathione lyase